MPGLAKGQDLPFYEGGRIELGESAKSWMHDGIEAHPGWSS